MFHKSIAQYYQLTNLHRFAVVVAVAALESAVEFVDRPIVFDFVMMIEIPVWVIAIPRYSLCRRVNWS